MKRNYSILVVFAFALSGCGATPAGLPIPSACPLVVGNDGFEFTLPCNSVEQTLTTPTPGLSYEKLFKAEDGTLYGIEVVAANGGPSGVGGITLGDQGNFRLDGLFRTAFGDTVLLTTLRIDGIDVRRVIGLLSDGSMLRIAVAPTNSLLDFRLKAGNLDLIGTDGSNILSPSPSGTTLIAPVSADLIVARSDNTIWELSSSDRLSVSSWTVGDIVVSMPATAFGFDAFLIRYPDLVSIGARFLDNGSQATVTAKTPGSSCTSVTLSTGAEWFACTDKAVLDSIQVGETVSHYNSSSSGVAFLLRLADGKAALVVP